MTDFCVPKLIVPTRSADFISDTDGGQIKRIDSYKLCLPVKMM